MDYIGFIAALLTTGSFLPQALKTIKTRDTESISLLMYVMFITGVAGWIVYGIHVGDLPIILANTVTFVLASIVLCYKLTEVATKWQKAKSDQHKQ